MPGCVVTVVELNCKAYASKSVGYTTLTTGPGIQQLVACIP